MIRGSFRDPSHILRKNSQPNSQLGFIPRKKEERNHCKPNMRLYLCLDCRLLYVVTSRIHKSVFICLHHGHTYQPSVT
jgi:hypothetical protein